MKNLLKITFIGILIIMGCLQNVDTSFTKYDDTFLLKHLETIENPIVIIQFVDVDGEICGCVMWQYKRVHFIGNVDKSAKIFFENIQDKIDTYIEEYIKEEMGR